VAVREAGHDAGGAVGQQISMTANGPAPLPVRRGDWIVADDDGVVCLPRAQVSGIIAEAMSSLTRERALVDAVAAGESTLDLLGLDPSRVAGWEGANEDRARSGFGRTHRLGRRDTPVRAADGLSAVRARGPQRPALGDAYGGD
jgi:4-hydroxy-4-methyl-2-oxoglutarate aldolase